MRSQLLPAVRLLLALTLLTGLIYPGVVTALCQALFSAQANGSLVMRGGRVLGSRLLAQPFAQPRYFHPRPSAAGPLGYDAANSGGSNLGPTSRALVDAVRSRIAAFRAANPDFHGEIPSDLVTASGSGLDPDISPAAALAQAPRVARARGLELSAVAGLIARHTQAPTFGLLGDPRVNVLELNLALDLASDHAGNQAGNQAGVQSGNQADGAPAPGAGAAGVEVHGVVSGALIQPGPGPQGTLTNALVALRKSAGRFEFFLQAGAYDIPTLAAPFLSDAQTLGQLFGPVPVAYVKLHLGGALALTAGKLPTLVGAEQVFTYQNDNIVRGLLFNQENTINRGVQLDDKLGPLTASLSWNDGFYSNRYTWLTGALEYDLDAHSHLELDGGGNFSRTAIRAPATPAQNNGSVVDVAYARTSGAWSLQPYGQWSRVGTASTRGAALLLAYHRGGHFSLAGRGEWLATRAGADSAPNLLLGPGSAAWETTLTPGWRAGPYFARGDLSWIQALRFTPGEGLGASGMKRSLPGLALEAGFAF